MMNFNNNDFFWLENSSFNNIRQIFGILKEFPMIIQCKASWVIVLKWKEWEWAYEEPGKVKEYVEKRRWET